MKHSTNIFIDHKHSNVSNISSESTKKINVKLSFDMTDKEYQLENIIRSKKIIALQEIILDINRFKSIRMGIQFNKDLIPKRKFEI